MNFDYKEYSQKFNDFEKKYAPNELFVSGDATLLDNGRRVSVVGSRNPSKLGLKRASYITKLLVQRDITVVSGLAQGIDTVAHSTAINENGKTIAVLGTSLNKTYPSSNFELLEEIKKNHLAISQFPVGYPAQPSNFPIRNRTMALISDATIIIEASEKSGTRHQGWEALRLGRHLYIMENLLNDNSISWAKQMLDYGAVVLTQENKDYILDNIPSLTEKFDFA